MTESIASIQTTQQKKPTPLFLMYAGQLVFRLGLFIYALYLFISKPELLSVSQYFGPARGFNSIDFIFLAIAFDFATKFFSQAKLAMGSLKQYPLSYTPTATKTERMQLRKQRMTETIPTAIVWILLNVAIALILQALGLLTPQVALMWCLFYFVFDMVCVVLWCPVQVVVMKNRCCTTCQVFNWDASMAATPLLFVGGWFSAILISMALIVLVRWEVAAARHPERFNERTNALLLCSNCTDQLCFIRAPYRNPQRTKQ